SALLKALQRIYEIEANVKPEALKTAQGFATALKVVKKIEALHGKVANALQIFQDIGFGEPAIKLIIDPKGTVSDQWEKISGIFDKMSPGSDLDQLESISEYVDKAEQELMSFVSS